MKRPAFMFYPGDWQRDIALRSCSLAARGLWIEMMCVMHQGEPYGHLGLNGKTIDDAQLARMLGVEPGELTRLLKELEAAGVFSRDATKRIYSRRMVKDEALREKRAAAGALGGNPQLLAKVKHEDNLKGNGEDNQKPTPSVAVAVSASSKSTVERQAKELLDYLNEVSGHDYRPVKANLQLIEARLREGIDAQVIGDVIKCKAIEWKNDPQMAKYLRPATLFNATKFHQYAGQLRGGRSQG